MKKKNNGTYVSLDETIGIREFMRDYLNHPFTDEGHITHEIMDKFLEEHGYSKPRKVAIKDLSTSKILTGEVLLVRAENKSRDCVDFKSKRGTIMPYVNPLRISFTDRLLQELQSGEYIHKLLSDPDIKQEKGNEFKKERNNKRSNYRY